MAHSSSITCSSQDLFLINSLLIFLLIPFSTPLEFNFPSMTHPNPSLITQGNITYLSSDKLQLTTNRTDQIGRVRYFQPFQLWDNSSGTVEEADFATEFSFSVYSNDRAPGDGVAFFLAQPPFLMPEITDGSGIGLVSHEELNSSATPFVAVEFDTFRNTFDPPGHVEHVGINVNSMVSNKTIAWACTINSMKVYNATVSYASKSRSLSVVFTGYIEEVPIRQSLFYEIRLSDYLPESVTFGFSAANGLFTSKHILNSWSFNSTLEIETKQNPSNGLQTSQSSNSGAKWAAGLSTVGGFVIISVLGLICFVFWKNKRRPETEDSSDDLVFDVSMDDDFERSSGARRFFYDELLSATNSFAKEEKLGEGGFGEVYRGYLKSLNSYVAIKRVSKWSTQGIKEYASEVKIVSRLRHKNLVQLVGWCHKKGDLLLVYEFMPNGSLDSHLFKSGICSLTWEARYNIALGLASALRYLHEECEKCILHRDIKPNNIVLDSQFNAKLGDFGLARLVDHGKGSQTTMLAGTLGYLAPECVMTGKATRQSDVYSFGVVALEIACGRKAIGVGSEDDEKGLVEWAWELHEAEKILEAADPKLLGKFDRQQMERLILVGLWCSHPDWGFRPSIKHASHVLDFQAPLPNFPPNLDVYSSLSSSIKVGHRSSITSGYTSAQNTQTKSFSSSDASHFTDPNFL